MLIRKGNHKIEVSPDAFKSMYKRLGYEAVKASKPLANTKGNGENKNQNDKTNQNDNNNK